jgi:RNA polymerase sigma factor (sigma-70 family)
VAPHPGVWWHQVGDSASHISVSDRSRHRARSNLLENGGIRRGIRHRTSVGSMGNGLDRDADFRLLYERHAPSVAKYVVRRAGSSQSLVSDVASETFVAAWRKWPSVPPEPETLPWLLGVARRQLAAHRRMEHRAQVAKESATDRSLIADPHDPQARERARAVLDALPELDREIFRLHCWERLDQTEIGVVVGLSRKAVERRMARARARFRRSMNAATYGADGRLSRVNREPGLASGEVVK